MKTQDKVFAGKSVIAIVAFFFASWVQALPLQLDQAAFSNAISGYATIVEDFESRSTGYQDNPFVFANGSYSSPFSDPYIWASAAACGEANDKCLSNSSVRANFSALPANTLYWGAAFYSIVELSRFDITVIGGSGSLNLSLAPARTFYGFHDPLGLVSISFRNRGEDLGSAVRFGYYMFDDITTAVPAPTTILLLIGAFAALLRQQSGRVPQNFDAVR